MIKNRAAIYFDFNDPIITNQTIHTIRTPIFATSEHIELCEGDDFQGFQVFNDTLVVDSTFISEGLQLDFYYLKVQSDIITTIDTMILLGSYFNDVLINQDTTIELVLQTTLGCDSTIINYISGITNVEDLNNLYQVKVFPTPAEEKVLISWNTGLSPLANISLMTTNGQILKNIEAPENSGIAKMDITALPQGVYWLKIDFPEGSIYQRIVKI